MVNFSCFSVVGEFCAVMAAVAGGAGFCGATGGGG